MWYLSIVHQVQREEEEEKRRSEKPSDFSLEPVDIPDDSDDVDEETEVLILITSE